MADRGRTERTQFIFSVCASGYDFRAARENYKTVGMFSYCRRINGARQSRLRRKREDALETNIVPNFDAVRQLVAFIPADGSPFAFPRQLGFSSNAHHSRPP
jgi:hypothetical protein